MHFYIKIRDEKPFIHGNDRMSLNIHDGIPEGDLGIPESQITKAERCFPGYRVIFSETFTQKSKDRYGPEWMTRELVQNFVDGNEKNPGTLNGVHFKKTETENGMHQYAIAGDWPFHDYTGLVGMHSGKVEKEGTAGGNGIGLKQTALGIMRDYGVKRFDIIGEGWEVQYKFVTADEINKILKIQGKEQQVQTGFLMARALKSANRGQCRYILEVPSGEMSAAMDRFEELGVSDRNPHLQEMHYQNQHGAMKWLGDRDTNGRLYFNGQAYRYAGEYIPYANDRKKRAYWDGPGGMTLRLNQRQYDMSIDRPPLSPYELTIAAKKIIESMNKEEMIRTLKDSQHLWSGYTGESERSFCINFLEQIIFMLWQKFHFKKTDFDTVFPGKKYYAYNKRLSHEQKEEYESQGIIFCPDFFEKIGVPLAPVKQKEIQYQASYRGDSGDRVDMQKVEDALFRLSTEGPVEVSYDEYPQWAQKPGEIANHFAEKFGKNEILGIDGVAGSDNKLQIELNLKISKSDLAAPQDRYGESVRKYHFLKGLVKRGKERGFITEAVLQQPGVCTEFIAPPGISIFVINTEQPGREKTFVQITFSDAKSAEEFQQGFRERSVKKGRHTKVRSDSAHDSADSTDRTEEPKKQRKTPAIIKGLIYTALVGTLGWAGYKEWQKHPAGTLANDGNSSGSGSVLVAGNQAGSQKNSALRKVDKNLQNILDAYRADIPEVHDERKPASVPNHEELDVDLSKIEVIQNPTESQTKQLELLREFFHLTTKYLPQNQFFIFRGPQVRGVNKGGLVGMHEALLKESFENALATLTHEIAHDASSDGHGVGFRAALQALFAVQADTLGNIARREPSKRTEEEKKAMAIEAKWDELRRQ